MREVCLVAGEEPVVFVQRDLLQSTGCGGGCAPTVDAYRQQGASWVALPLPEDLRVMPEADLDGDGIVDLGDVILGELVLGTCPRVECREDLVLRARVWGPAAWTGQRFSVSKPALVPIHRERYEAALGTLRGLGPQPPDRCPLEALQAGAELYMAGRLAGVSTGQLLSELDAVMKDASTAPCAAEHQMTSPPTSWPRLRQALVAWQPPR